MLMEACILSLMWYTGSKIYRNIRGENSSESESRNKGAGRVKENPVKNAESALTVRLDNACQRFFQTRIDPLLSGKTRHRQIVEISSDGEDPVSEDEKSVNRSLVLSAATIGVAVTGHFFFRPLLVASTGTAIWMMLPLYGDAFGKLIHERRITNDLLTVLYVTGFWATGYLVFGTIGCFLHLAGEKSLFRMEERSRNSLGGLFDLQPRTVWVVVDGTEVSIPFDELQKGDLVVTNPGEPIPVDGVVTKGFGSVDQRMLTGEAQPVEKEAGDPVFASTLLLNGRLFVRVEKAGSDTVAAQIAKIMIRTSEYKTKIETKGRELAEKTILPNVAASLLALALIGPVGSVAALGAGVGINMEILSSLAMMNYLIIASRRSILVKDGRALDRLKEVDTFVFDKTGTLTLEQPRVGGIHLCQDDLTEDALLAWAAAAEFRQTHPVAKAVLAEAKDRGLTLPEVDEAGYEVGYGIRATISGKLVRIGIPDQIRNLMASSADQGHSLVMVALDSHLSGVLELCAAVRPEAESMVRELRGRKLSVAIISGDQDRPTAELARILGIDEYYAGILPDNKADLIRQMQEEGRVVCYVGDGINDAIALKQADVSVSLRGATTIATDTAQVVLMDQDLGQLAYLLDLASRFDKTLRTGFLTTIVPGVTCIGGVFLLHFGIYASEILFQVGLLSGLGVAMTPLLTDEEKNPDEKSDD